jgi:hypothetical protein
MPSRERTQGYIILFHVREFVEFVEMRKFASGKVVLF